MIHTRWDNLSKDIKEKEDKLKTVQDQLEKYQSNFSPVMTDLSEIQSKADVEMVPVADLDKVKDFKSELQDLLSDFEKLNPSLADVIESGQDIVDGNPDMDTMQVKKNNEELQEKSVAVGALLSDKLAKAEALEKDLENYEEKEKELTNQLDDVTQELEKNKPEKMDVDLVKEQLENTKVWITILTL